MQPLTVKSSRNTQIPMKRLRIYAVQITLCVRCIKDPKTNFANIFGAKGEERPLS